ncbi:MAG: hypothetical protein JNL32_04830 [Candidatus Kapabacteria bacterium]|nr:hypothetical protein [Candidatus Kapabacteria bacterium]
MHRAAVVQVRTMTLDKVNEFIARIDTGYSLVEFTDMVKIMYSKSVKNFTTQKFDFILLQQIGD